MKLFAITVLDTAAAVYHAPIFVPALGLAERWFKDECNNPQSEISKHAADYTLWVIGSYDNESAELIADVPPRLLMRGSEAIRAMPVLS